MVIHTFILLLILFVATIKPRALHGRQMLYNYAIKSGLFLLFLKKIKKKITMFPICYLQLLSWNAVMASALLIPGTIGTPHQSYGNNLKWKQLNLFISRLKTQVLQKIFLQKWQRAKYQVAYTCNSNIHKVAVQRLLWVQGQSRLHSKTFSQKIE